MGKIQDEPNRRIQTLRLMNQLNVTRYGDGECMLSTSCLSEARHSLIVKYVLMLMKSYS